MEGGEGMGGGGQSELSHSFTPISCDRATLGARVRLRVRFVQFFLFLMRAHMQSHEASWEHMCSVTFMHSHVLIHPH